MCVVVGQFTGLLSHGRLMRHYICAAVEEAFAPSRVGISLVVKRTTWLWIHKEILGRYTDSVGGALLIELNIVVVARR